MPKQNFFKLALIVTAPLLLWMLRQPIMAFLGWAGNREAVIASLQPLGIWGATALFILLILQVFLALIPGQALMVACSYLYGFWDGWLLSWTGLVAGGQAAFWLARRYGRPFAERRVTPEALSKWDKTAKGRGLPFYVAALVLPVFPNDAMCYVAGLGKISSRRFTFANMLGRAISCLLASIVGTFGTQIPKSIWISTALVITGLCLSWRVFTNQNHSIGLIRKSWIMNTIYAVARFILKTYAFLFHRTHTVSGMENLPKGGKIIALNHTVGCDPLHLPLILDEKVHFLLQDGDFTIPLLGWMLRETEQIPVYRGTDRAKEALEQACQMLREGKTIVIFPEGKDVPYGERIRAKTGAVRMAMETGVPIIPLGIHVPPNSLRTIRFAWKGKKCSGLWQVTGKRTMCFGSPWHPGQTTSEVNPLDIHAATKELMDQIYLLTEVSHREKAYQACSILNAIPQW